MKNRILFLLISLSVASCGLYADMTIETESNVYAQYESAQLSKKFNKRKHKVLVENNKRALKEGEITKKQYKKNKKKENKRFESTKKLIKQKENDAIDSMLFEEENN